MISLITCSVNKKYLQLLKQNVEEYIGCKYEWLIWDNTEAQEGLCKVYNKLAEKARYPYLCFLHEDILIETPLWGSMLMNVCEEDEGIGLIGVAGGKYKSDLFSGWYSGGNQLDYYSIIHRDDEGDKIMCKPLNWEKSEVDVAALDGVFMFCKKSVWGEIRFNDKLLKGFHCYDIDFSLRAAQLHKVVVTNRLILTHYTKGGDFGDKWIEATFAFHNAMKKQLPFSVVKNIPNNINILVAKYWLDWLKNMPITLKNRMKWIRLQKLYKRPVLWYSIIKFIFYKPLRLQVIHKWFKPNNFPA